MSSKTIKAQQKNQHLEDNIRIHQEKVHKKSAPKTEKEVLP